MGGVNPELLSIRQLVGITDEEGSGCNDAEARGPPEATGSNRFEIMSPAASMVPVVVSRPPFLFLLFIYKQLEWLIWVRQGKGWGF